MSNESEPKEIAGISPEERQAFLSKLPIGSLCAFSDHPRVFCAWDTVKKEMYPPQQCEELGITVSPTGFVRFAKEPMNLIIRWFTGHIDTNERMIFEGDILEADITNEFGSMERAFMIAVWDTTYGGFIMKLKQSLTGKKVPVTNVRHVGNEMENPELIKKHFSNE